MVTNLDKYKSIGTHWVELHENGDNITYFDMFGVRLDIVQRKLKNSQATKYCNKYLYSRSKWFNVMYQYFCIGFIDFMLKRKSLLDYNNLFSPIKYENNEKIYWNTFDNLKLKNLFHEQTLKRWRWKKYIVWSEISIENLKTL